MVSLSQNGRMKTTPIHSPLQATVVQWLVQPAATFKQGDVLVILEAMKMEHEVRALSDGRVIALNFAVGDLVNEGESLLQTELSRPGSQGQLSSNKPAIRQMRSSRSAGI